MAGRPLEDPRASKDRAPRLNGASEGAPPIHRGTDSNRDRECDEDGREQSNLGVRTRRKAGHVGNDCVDDEGSDQSPPEDSTGQIRQATSCCLTDMAFSGPAHLTPSSSADLPSMPKPIGGRCYRVRCKALLGRRILGPRKRRKRQVSLPPARDGEKCALTRERGVETRGSPSPTRTASRNRYSKHGSYRTRTQGAGEETPIGP